MTSDFQRAFEPDAPRELVEAVNKMCAGAEWLELNLPCKVRINGRGKWFDETRPNPLSDYVHDMNNLMRLREKAIAKDSGEYARRLWMTTLTRAKENLDPVQLILWEDQFDDRSSIKLPKHLYIKATCAQHWAILKAAHDVLIGKEDGK